MAILSNSKHASQAAQQLHIFVLGSPKVMWNDQLIEIPRRRARALLIRLAARLDAVSRDHLCFLFWPDAPDITARRNLSHLLTHLRLALPIPDVITTAGDVVSLDSTRVWVDTVHLHHLCCSGEATLDPSVCWQALDLIRGPFLDGFSLPHCPEYELWVIQEQQHWDCQILRLLSKLTFDGAPPPYPGENVTPSESTPDSRQLAAQIERRLAQVLLSQVRVAIENASSLEL